LDGAPLAGALVTLAGPLSFGCAESADGAPPAELVEVAPGASGTGDAWPAVGSTACARALGTVPLVVVVAFAVAASVDELSRTCACVSLSSCCVLEPHPATSTSTAIAVTPAARMR
jgi:hypothetical protein